MGEWNYDLYQRPLTNAPEFPVTEKMLELVGIGSSYWKTGIKLIPNYCGYRKIIERMVNDLPRDTRVGRGAIFHGKHGYGKTTAAAIMLKAAMARGGQVFHRKASQLEFSYDKRWQDKTWGGIPVWEILTRSQLLTIDDLGNELRPSGFRAGDIVILEELVRERYDNRLTTYITTNLTVPDLLERYSSIATIFLDTTRYRMVEVSGFNWRRRDNDGE